MHDLLIQLLAILAGRAGPSDLLQDQIGARALLSGANPYPILGPAMAHLGVVWPIAVQSTHPPTAFLFLLPIAGLSWPAVALLWTVLQVGALAVTAWAAGLPGRALPLLVPLVLWPPLLSALGQFTVLWLCGLALAWRFRDRPFVAGVCIGLASLPKLTPMICLVPFVRRRAWGALAGFSTVWLCALALLLCLERGAIGAYLAANRGMTLRTIVRRDNGALVPYLLHRYGHLGLLIGVALLAWGLLGALHAPTAGQEWARWCWLAVALLPIAWTYSLAPLLPGLLGALRDGRPYQRVAAAAALVVPFWGAVPSTGPGVVALSMAAGGAAVLGLEQSRVPQGTQHEAQRLPHLGLRRRAVG